MSLDTLRDDFNASGIIARRVRYLRRPLERLPAIFEPPAGKKSSLSSSSPAPSACGMCLETLVYSVSSIFFNSLSIQELSRMSRSPNSSNSLF
ncbi:hypothetical protein FBU59_002959 [Linderina macrospora]|uniref:Uncharacterized protein n=1 Tax=Linderina macrospora TaxID=4868 RepID=A0ACC1J9R8_9FUNG|nr:hypothetical protein FBU59_002959 [Linderina macrospora]